MHWHVVENTPGYLPDDMDDSTFIRITEARNYAMSLAQELREQGYHVSGNRKYGYYAEKGNNDLGRVIEVLPCTDPLCEIETEEF